MRVMVNGEPREISSASVDALLSELEYEGSHLAIAVNYDVVPKGRWAETRLQAGEEIEIITPRQGGGFFLMNGFDEEAVDKDAVSFYGKEFSSRLLIGSALYPSPAIMQEAIRASG